MLISDISSTFLNLHADLRQWLLSNITYFSKICYYADYQISNEYIQRLRECFSIVVEKMDLKRCGVIAYLYSRKVIDQREKDNIEAEPNSSRQNEMLLSILLLKSAQQFAQFLDSMNNTGNCLVVNVLYGNSVSMDDRGKNIIIT